MKFILRYFFIAALLTSCQTVSKKIDEKVSEEEKRLSKWLNTSEEDLKIEFGIPNEIRFKDNSRNRYYVYTKQKLKIKCERVFELSQNNKVIGFTRVACRLEVIVSVQPNMHEKTRFVYGLLVTIVLYRIQSEHFAAPLECIFATSLLSLFQTDDG